MKLETTPTTMLTTPKAEETKENREELEKSEKVFREKEDLTYPCLSQGMYLILLQVTTSCTCMRYLVYMILSPLPTQYQVGRYA